MCENCSGRLTAPLSLSSFSCWSATGHAPDAKGQAMPRAGAFKFQAPLPRRGKGKGTFPLSAPLSILLSPPPLPFQCCQSVVYWAEPPAWHLGTSQGRSRHARQPSAKSIRLRPPHTINHSQSTPVLHVPLFAGRRPGEGRGRCYLGYEEGASVKDLHPPSTNTASEMVPENKEHLIRLGTQSRSLLSTAGSPVHGSAFEGPEDDFCPTKLPSSTP